MPRTPHNTTLAQLKRCGNTRVLVNEDGVNTLILVRLHQTEIVILSTKAGTLELDCGGWRTPTTIRRINQALQAFQVVNAATKEQLGIGKSIFDHSDRIKLHAEFDPTGNRWLVSTFEGKAVQS